MIKEWKCLNDPDENWEYNKSHSKHRYKVGFCNGCSNKCNRCGCDGLRRYEIVDFGHKDGELFISMPTHAIILDMNKKSWKFHEYGS